MPARRRCRKMSRKTGGEMRADEEDAMEREEKAARVARALGAVGTCADSISYNVSPETCISAMLLEIREALYGSHSAR